MPENRSDRIIKRIDELHKMHLGLRGILQYIGEQHNGKNQINWNATIPSQTIRINYNFPRQITDETRFELNKLSEYLNQNFIVRLHSLLEYEKIKDDNNKIDTTLEGYEMLEVIHFLRIQFAHKDGVYNPNNEKARILRERLFRVFNIHPDESLPNQFPLDKNRVILPIVEGVKKYVKAFCENK
jgi:hypothetical protein